MLIDVHAREFWERQKSAYFDIRVCHPYADSYKDLTRGFTCRVSGCGKDHHYLIHPGENVDGNSAEPTRQNTFESGGSTNNMRQPVTEHQSNQAQTIVDTVN